MVKTAQNLAACPGQPVGIACALAGGVSVPTIVDDWLAGSAGWLLDTLTAWSNLLQRNGSLGSTPPQTPLLACFSPQSTSIMVNGRVTQP